MPDVIGTQFLSKTQMHGPEREREIGRRECVCERERKKERKREREGGAKEIERKRERRPVLKHTCVFRS